MHYEISLKDIKTILDELVYIDQATDISYGRFTNGVGAFQKMNPTFGVENDGKTGTLEINTESIGMEIYPNPAQNEIMIVFDI